MTDKPTPELDDELDTEQEAAPTPELDDELDDEDDELDDGQAPEEDTTAVTCLVETAMLGWSWHDVVTVERTDYVELLIASGRLTVLDAG